MVPLVMARGSNIPLDVTLYEMARMTVAAREKAAIHDDLAMSVSNTRSFRLQQMGAYYKVDGSFCQNERTFERERTIFGTLKMNMKNPVTVRFSLIRQ